MSELYAADNNQKKIFPVIFSDTDFSLSDSAKGVTFVIGSINWTMLRPGIDDYGQSLEKLICAIKKIKGIYNYANYVLCYTAISIFIQILLKVKALVYRVAC